MVTGRWYLQVTNHCDSHHKRIIVIHLSYIMCNLASLEWSRRKSFVAASCFPVSWMPQITIFLLCLLASVVQADTDTCGTAYKSLPAQCVEVSTNDVSVSLPSFLRLAQTENQPILLRIAAVSKFTKYFELLLYQYSRLATYTLCKKSSHIHPVVSRFE